jgi:hypothetical protein
MQLSSGTFAQDNLTRLQQDSFSDACLQMQVVAAALHGMQLLHISGVLGGYSALCAASLRPGARSRAHEHSANFSFCKVSCRRQAGDPP